MAVVTHLILLVRHRVFAFTRLMAVASALALALILGHLVPSCPIALVCPSGRMPSSRASLIPCDPASSQCKRRRSSSTISSARPRYHSASVGDMPIKRGHPYFDPKPGKFQSGLLSPSREGPQHSRSPGMAHDRCQGFSCLARWRAPRHGGTGRAIVNLLAHSKFPVISTSTSARNTLLKTNWQ